jgi:hypothetical protein
MDRDNLEQRIRQIQDELIHIKTSQKINSDRFKFYIQTATIRQADSFYDLEPMATVWFNPDDQDKDYIVACYDSSRPTYGLAGEDTLTMQNRWQFMRPPHSTADMQIILVSTIPGKVTVNY